jgi:hypothetical protein
MLCAKTPCAAWRNYGQRGPIPDAVRTAVPGRMTRNVVQIVRATPVPATLRAALSGPQPCPLLRIDPTERVRPPASMDG